jgi:hypothetical protein
VPWPRLLLVFLVAGVAASCDGSTGRSFRAEFPEVVLDPDNDIVMEAVPVSLEDGTGLVESLAVLADDGQFIEAGVTGNPADPQVLEVRWGGGSCLERIRIAISGTDASGYAVEVQELAPFLMLGCPGLGISRGVAISLARAVPADRVSLEVDPQ